MSEDGSVEGVFDGIELQRNKRRELLLQDCVAAARVIDVTVAVMSYNNASYISKTIESVLEQADVSLEVIVYDDCSADDSLRIIESFSGDPRFSFEVNEKNLGMTGNYNRCIYSGSGRYVVVLGSDDIMYPGHLSSLVQAMDLNPQSALGYTQCNWIDKDGSFIRYAQHPGHKLESYFGNRDEVVDLLCYDNYITPSAAIFRRSLLASIALDDGSIHRHDMLAGDWDLFIRIAHKFPDFVYLHQPSVGYRVHQSQISGKFYDSDRPLSEHTEILERYLSFPDLAARLISAADGIWELYATRLGNYPESVRQRYHSRAESIRKALFSPVNDYSEDELIFSVIITTFNRPKMLIDALSSLSQQSFKGFEVVLVNDCGAPIEELLSAFDFPITYIKQGANKGLSAARNAGLRLAKGDFICFLDDDDFFMADHLECLFGVIQSYPQCSLFYTDAYYVEEVLEGEQRIPGARSVPYAHSEFSAERLAVSNYIPVNTWCTSRQLFDEVGDFDTDLPALEDWEIFQRLARVATPLHVPRPTVEVRVRGSAADHMSHLQRKNFPALFRDIYSRYPNENNRVTMGRQEILARLDAEMAGKRFKENPDSAANDEFPARAVPAQHKHSVQDWFEHRQLTERQIQLISQRFSLIGSEAHIGVIVLDLQGNSQKLLDTIKSLKPAQGGYQSLTIVTLTTADIELKPVIDGLVIIKVDISNYVSIINEVIHSSHFDWLMLVQAGEAFTPAGLISVALQLLDAYDCRAVYGDELQQTSEAGLGAMLRPGFNLDLLLSFPAAMARHWLFRREAFLSVGGFDPAMNDALEFDLLLRLIEQGGVTGLGHVDEPLLKATAFELVDASGEQLALLRHLHNRGYESASLKPYLPGRYRISYGHDRQPLVSIIIPTKDQLPILQRCVESLLEKTRYPHYELLIVDNNSETPEACEWLDGVAQLGEDKVRVLRYPYPFNYSAINNMAAREARGEYLVLLNNDTAIISESWLDDLLNHAQRPEVGIVGAKLLYPDGRIQHAGVILGLRGPAEHPFIGEPMDAPGYMQRLQVDQNYSAVTAACLMVRKSIYDEVGGLDEEAFKVSYNDVDLCLKVGQQGYLIVWTPHAVVMHEGSVSQKQVDPATQAAKRKRFLTEQDAMYEKWLPQLANDPAYNSNLALTGSGFSLETNADLTWRPLAWRPLPVVLAHNADPWGCGNYRIIKPHKAMKAAGLIDGAVSNRLLDLPELARLAPDVVVYQRQTKSESIENMARSKRFSSAFKVYELDDYLPNTPIKNAHRATLSKDLVKLLRKGLGHVDRFVVSTPALANALADYHSDIRVIENRLPLDWWGQLEIDRKPSVKPRVGWAGGVGHQGDLELIADVVRDLAKEVDWVFFGMCPEKLKPYMTEFYPGVDIELYPQKLAELNLDLALAPLEDNLFNSCKSNLRLLEYGVCGFPVIASDIECYRGNLPVTLVKNRYRDWMDAIRGQLAERDALSISAESLTKAVRKDWMLEGGNLEQWRSVWLPD